MSKTVKNIKGHRHRQPNAEVKLQARFFDNLGSDYLQTVENEYASIYNNTRKVIQPHIRGRVLDIGSGGVELFQSNAQYVYFDIASILLGYHNTSQSACNVCNVCGESSFLPFSDSTFDTVLFHFSIHHFAQASFLSTVNYVKQAIQEASRVCRPGGRIIVAENCVGMFVEFFESLLYPLMRMGLSSLGSPPVFLFSEQKLKDCFRANHLEPVTLFSFKEPSRLLVAPVNIKFTLNPVTIKVIYSKNGKYSACPSKS